MRVKSQSIKKHRQVLELAKGYRLARSKRYRTAHESVLHAGQHAFIGRKLRKRDKRREWITQINAALTNLSMTTGEPKLRYSEFIHKLKDAKVNVDRKILAQMTINDLETFEFIVGQARLAESRQAKAN